MKLNRRFWLILGLIAACYAGIMTYVRWDNDAQTKLHFYHQWQESYVIRVNRRQSFVNAGGGQHKALSEAQGYGMLITVLAAKKNWASQEEFQRLDDYYLAHRDVYDKQKTNLMAWRQVKTKHGWENDPNSATDGDVMIAQALLMAAEQWPKTTDYRRQALALMKDILRFELNPKTMTLTVGDWADQKSSYHDLLRTSDVMPAAFRSFYQASGDQTWLQVENAMLKKLDQLSKREKTGLVPDFAWVSPHRAWPVKANTVESKNDGSYSDNAARVPLLLAQSKNPKAQKILLRMLRFFRQQRNLTAGYSLKGKPLNDYQAASFSAPIFYAVNVHRNEGFDALYTREKFIFAQRLPSDRYYDATLTTLVALMS